MNQFLKKENHQNKNFFIIVVIIVCIGLFLYFCHTKERYIEDFYYENTLYTKETMNDDIEDAKQNEYTSEDFLKTQKQSEILFNKFDSLVSSDQSFFLQAEINNQQLNVELSDEFEGLNYNNYIQGKVDINTYLIKHKLPLKSVEYSTDSAIFTMNTLEFLNTPLFFLLFFLSDAN